MGSIDPTILAIIVIAVVVVVVLAIAYNYSQNRNRERLRERFGPEYDRLVDEKGRRGAERDLSTREKRVSSLEIRPLSAEERARFSQSWQAVQARFVDDPAASVDDADMLVGQLMQTRGYPISDFEQRAADVSVNHPDVVDNYRKAHEIALAEDRGQAQTEDLRTAMVYYRSLFNDLLGRETPAAEYQGGTDIRPRT
jgi:hypothetical protein